MVFVGGIQYLMPWRQAAFSISATSTRLSAEAKEGGDP